MPPKRRRAAPRQTSSGVSLGFIGVAGVLSILAGLGWTYHQLWELQQRLKQASFEELRVDEEFQSWIYRFRLLPQRTQRRLIRKISVIQDLSDLAARLESPQATKPFRPTGRTGPGGPGGLGGLGGPAGPGGPGVAPMVIDNEEEIKEAEEKKWLALKRKEQRLQHALNRAERRRKAGKRVKGYLSPFQKRVNRQKKENFIRQQELQKRRQAQQDDARVLL